MNVQHHTKRRIGALSVAKMMVARQEGCTVHEMAEASGLCAQTVRSYALALHREGGCYIDEWQPNSRGVCTIASYRLGPGRDVTRPRKSHSTTSREWRAKRAHVAMVHAMAGATQQ